MFRPGYRDDVPAAREQPRERKLRGGASFARRELRDGIDETKIAGEVLTLEPRVVAAPVIRREIVGRLVAAGQKPASERAVRDEADPELAARRQDRFIVCFAARRA